MTARVPRHIVLVGLMGAGKTTVGRMLAERLGRPFSDSDDAIEATTGLTGRAIAASDGLPRLHALEAAHLRDVLSAPSPSVVAAAASVVDDARCRRALRRPDVAVIWLRARPQVLATRFASGTHRADHGGPPAAILAAQGRERRRRFAAIRPLLTVDADDMDVAAIVDAMLAALLH